MINHSTKHPVRLALMALVIIGTALSATAQVGYTKSGRADIVIAGTSTLHDWTMTSQETDFDAMFETNPEGKPVKLTAFHMSVLTKSLKSGKESMDKNAYTALKADVYKEITFEMIHSTMDTKSIMVSGKLTIAGSSQFTELEVFCSLRPDNALHCKGSKKIGMHEFNVVPPTFMFGTVKTGDEIVISYDVILGPTNPQTVIIN